MIYFSSASNSTEDVIREMIKQCESNIIERPPNSLVRNKHLRIQINILQSAPRDPEKLKRLLKEKEKECGNAKYVLDTERLVTEIEMLKVVLYLVCRNKHTQK
jgi:hypothetical protein